MHILIADDSPVSLNFLKKILENWGHQVTAVTDGKAALGVLQGEEAPNLAILDWSMPELEGIEVCRRVKEKSKDTYIILLTAKDSTEDIVAAESAGTDDYICKPFVKEELKLRLNSGLRILGMTEALKKAGLEIPIV